MQGVLPVSRYDTLVYDITLEEMDTTTGVLRPVETGSVTAALSAWPPSLTSIANTSIALQHLGSGRWIGEVTANVLGAALVSIPDGTPISVIYTRSQAMVRYREAQVVSIRRVEAL